MEEKKTKPGHYRFITRSNGTDYQNPDDVEIATMSDYIYMGMKNDVSFIVDGNISLYEHQSTYNPNMPVRMLMYLGRQYDKYIKRTGQNIYGQKQMHLPMPRLEVFYNGKYNVSDRILKLSDSFPPESDLSESDVEVLVHMYNIRPQYNSTLLEECKPLREYSWFVEAIRRNSKLMEMVEAVDKAIKDMPEDFEIRHFLEEHQSEVRSMCITEYDEAETMQMFKEEGREEGIKEAIADLNALNRWLIEQGRTEDVFKATTDQEFQKSLFAEMELAKKQ